jgi:hypothetical protein
MISFDKGGDVSMKVMAREMNASVFIVRKLSSGSPLSEFTFVLSLYCQLLITPILDFFLASMFLGETTIESFSNPVSL